MNAATSENVIKHPSIGKKILQKRSAKIQEILKFFERVAIKPSIVKKLENFEKIKLKVQKLKKF